MNVSNDFDKKCLFNFYPCIKLFTKNGNSVDVQMKEQRMSYGDICSVAKYMVKYYSDYVKFEKPTNKIENDKFCVTLKATIYDFSEFLKFVEVCDSLGSVRSSRTFLLKRKYVEAYDWGFATRIFGKDFCSAEITFEYIEDKDSSLFDIAKNLSASSFVEYCRDNSIFISDRTVKKALNS